MNWQAIGAIGEIGGFLAVLVTLAFLYGQVRQLTRQGALSLIDSAHQPFLPLALEVASSADLSKLLHEADSGSELSPERVVQFGSYLNYVLICYQIVFTKSQDGLLTAEYWKSSESALAEFVGSSTLRKRLTTNISNTLDPRFQAVLKRLLSGA